MYLILTLPHNIMGPEFKIFSPTTFREAGVD
jgi:hypothetical protein